MRILAFDPAGEGGDIGWAIVDTETKKVTYGKMKSNYIRFSIKGPKKYF